MKILKLPREATVEDLYELDERAELVNGQLVLMEGSASLPNRAAARIWKSLDAYEVEHGGGFAYTEGATFIVTMPLRRSFSPDAAWYAHPGPLPTEFVHAPPTLAVEVRNPGDYGLRAEREMKNKRADYFAAGTTVVWDVDVLREGVIRVYRANDPDTPAVYRRGDEAEAEPAVPGWRMPVDALFA